MFFWRCKTTVCCKPCIKNIFAKNFASFSRKTLWIVSERNGKKQYTVNVLTHKKILSTVTIVFMLLERRNVSWLRNRFLFRWKLTLGISRQLTKEPVLLRKLTLGTGFCLGESWPWAPVLFRRKLTSAISSQLSKEPVYVQVEADLGHLQSAD